MNVMIPLCVMYGYVYYVLCVLCVLRGVWCVAFGLVCFSFLFFSFDFWAFVLFSFFSFLFLLLFMGWVVWPASHGRGWDGIQGEFGTGYHIYPFSIDISDNYRHDYILFYTQCFECPKMCIFVVEQLT